MAKCPPDRQHVEQGLGRVLVLAVAGIDDGTADFLRQQRCRARRRMAHNQQVRLHGVERHRGVDQSLALGDRRRLHAHIDGIGAQPLAGQLEARLRPRGILEEHIDQGLALEQVQLLGRLPVQVDEDVCKIEQVHDIGRIEILRPQEMPLGEGQQAGHNGHGERLKQACMLTRFGRFVAENAAKHKREGLNS
jgi:hypothetical protein